MFDRYRRYLSNDTLHVEKHRGNKKGRRCPASRDVVPRVGMHPSDRLFDIDLKRNYAQVRCGRLWRHLRRQGQDVRRGAGCQAGRQAAAAGRMRPEAIKNFRYIILLRFGVPRRVTWERSLELSGNGVAARKPRLDPGLRHENLAHAERRPRGRRDQEGHHPFLAPGGHHRSKELERCRRLERYDRTTLQGFPSNSMLI